MNQNLLSLVLVVGVTVCHVVLLTWVSCIGLRLLVSCIGLLVGDY